MGRRTGLPLIVIALLSALGLALAGCPQPDQSGGGSTGAGTSAAKPAADYEAPENWPEPGSVVGYA
ncbi:hypothetical protein JW859_14135 [bacterium]|nr:hypothetical protein [bacterium]